MAGWAEGRLAPEEEAAWFAGVRRPYLEDLERNYRWLLARELRTVPLTLGEAVLLHEVCPRVAWISGGDLNLAEQVAEALEYESRTAAAQGDGATLAARLRALSLGQEVAVADALERVSQPSPALPLDVRLHKVGLGRWVEPGDRG